MSHVAQLGNLIPVFLRKILQTFGVVACAVSAVGVSSSVETQTRLKTETCAGKVLYRFQPGDTLSEVLKVLGHKGLFRRKGMVSKVVRANRSKFVRGRFGHIRSGVVLKLKVLSCPNPNKWSIKNGFLQRTAAEPHDDQPAPATTSAEPNTNSGDSDVSSPGETTNYEKTLPVEISILEPVQDSLPEAKTIEGEITEEALDGLINN